jgi:hypothetical protein
LGADATRRVARDSIVRVVDPGPELATFPPSTVFADFAHFTDTGAAVLASQTSSILAPQYCPRQ